MSRKFLQFVGISIEGLATCALILHAGITGATGITNIVIFYSWLMFFGIAIVSLSNQHVKEVQENMRKRNYSKGAYIYSCVFNWIYITLLAYFGWWVTCVVWVLIAGSKANLMAPVFSEGI